MNVGTCLIIQVPRYYIVLLPITVFYYCYAVVR